MAEHQAGQAGGADPQAYLVSMCVMSHTRLLNLMNPPSIAATTMWVRKLWRITSESSVTRLSCADWACPYAPFVRTATKLCISTLRQSICLIPMSIPVPYPSRMTTTMVSGAELWQSWRLLLILLPTACRWAVHSGVFSGVWTLAFIFGHTQALEDSCVDGATGSEYKQMFWW